LSRNGQDAANLLPLIYITRFAAPCPSRLPAQVDLMGEEGRESEDDEQLLAEFVTSQRRKAFAHTAAVIGAAAVAGTDAAASGLQREDSTELQQALDDIAVWQARITLKRIDSLRVMQTPPPIVRKIMDMVVLVLRLDLDTDYYARRGKKEFVDSWETIQTVLMRPRFTELLQDFDVCRFDDETFEFLEVYLHMPGITAAAARRASKDAHVLFEWILRLMEYRRLSQYLTGGGGDESLVPAHATSTILRHSSSDTAAVAATTAARAAPGGLVPLSSGDVQRLHIEYDERLCTKQALEVEGRALRARLSAMEKLNRNFAGLVAGWTRRVDHLRMSLATLVQDCVVAAAFSVYGSPATCSQRQRMRAVFPEICSAIFGDTCTSYTSVQYHATTAASTDGGDGEEPNDIDGKAAGPQRVLIDVPLESFLGHVVATAARTSASPGQAATTTASGPLPSGGSVVSGQANGYTLEMVLPLELQCLTALHALSPASTRWPYLIDPLRAGGRWLRRQCPDAFFAPYDDRAALQTALHACLATGRTLVVVEVDPQRLWRDELFAAVLRRQLSRNARHTLSVRVGDTEVEYNNGFRLILASHWQAVDPPLGLQPHVQVLWLEAPATVRERYLLGCLLATQQPDLHRRIHEITDSVTGQRRYAYAPLRNHLAPKGLQTWV